MRKTRIITRRPAGRSRLLDGGPRARLSRAVRGRPRPPTRSRRNTTTRGGRRLRAWWTSAAWSIRRSTPIGPTAKGPAGNHGSRLRGELAKRGQKLPLLGDDDVTADRNYIKEFVLARSRTLGQKYGVEYAEAFHYVGGRPPPSLGRLHQKTRRAAPVGVHEDQGNQLRGIAGRHARRRLEQ